MHPDQSYSDLLFIGMTWQQMTSEPFNRTALIGFKLPEFPSVLQTVDGLALY